MQGQIGARGSEKQLRFPAHGSAQRHPIAGRDRIAAVGRGQRQFPACRAIAQMQPRRGLPSGTMRAQRTDGLARFGDLGLSARAISGQNLLSLSGLVRPGPTATPAVATRVRRGHLRWLPRDGSPRSAHCGQAQAGSVRAVGRFYRDLYRSIAFHAARFLHQVPHTAAAQAV